MKNFFKKYKELILMLLPMCFLMLEWYQSFRVSDADFSVPLPYHGYEFLFYNRGIFLIIYLLCVMLQIISVKYDELRICAIPGHFAYLYCLLRFPTIFIGTHVPDFYSFYMTGAYIAIICEILVIILNAIEIFISPHS